VSRDECQAANDGALTRYFRVETNAVLREIAVTALTLPSPEGRGWDRISERQQMT